MTDLLDEVCAWVRGGSYVTDAQKLTDAVMAEDARLLAEAYTGEAGRRRLMVFARLTVLRPPVNHTLPDGEAQAYAQMRQGQDSIFAALVRYLDLHQAHQRTDADDRSIATEPRPDFGWGPATDAAFATNATDERFGPDTWDAGGEIAGR